jgi:DNA-binding response OmpR family regulator
MIIAWIDDDTDIIDPVIEPLEQDGHEIIRMRTVRGALDAVETLRTCDLILLDMIIPIGDDNEEWDYYSGASLLRKLREEHSVTTPVIAFSVVDSRKVEEQLDTLDVAQYVRKPALPSELKEAVDAVLGIEQHRAPV